MTSPQSPPVAQEGDGAAAVTAVLAAAETAFAAYVLAAYTKWLAAVSSAVLAGFLRFGVAPDPTAVWSTVPLWEQLVDGLIDRLWQLARVGWIEAARQLNVDLPWNPEDPLLADTLARTRNLMVRTPDHVYRQVIDVLGKSVAAGQTIEGQATAVRHVLDATGTENWASRAQTVAATEVHRAWNFGALAAAMRVQQNVPALLLLKRWDAREDSATRLGHTRADGQTVRVGQPFIVAREPLMAPGDPSGRPDNVINCRCKPFFTRREQ